MLHALGAHNGERQFQLARAVSSGLRTFTAGGILATAVVAWLVVRRWKAVTLALLAPTVTLGVEKLLKPLVARRAPASTVFHYPSGHVAVATALALSLVLIVYSSRLRPGVRTVAVLVTGLLVLVMALARMVETAHLLSDVIGGAATGVAVTLSAALVLDRGARAGGGSVRGGLLELHPQGLGEAGVQRADREHRQGDHGGGDQEAVQRGDQNAEQD
jgi:membrane-associated phospholipid phosphatase